MPVMAEKAARRKQTAPGSLAMGGRQSLGASVASVAIKDRPTASVCRRIGQLRASMIRDEPFHAIPPGGKA
jgi:hypothetical protein